MRPAPPWWMTLLPVALVLGCILLAMLIGWSAKAQDTRGYPCAPSAEVDAGLSNLGERVVAQGVIVNGKAIAQLWLNVKTKSFTVIVQLPNGKSCMVLSGDDLEIGSPS